jgi:hypothetical protein
MNKGLVVEVSGTETNELNIFLFSGCVFAFSPTKTENGVEDLEPLICTPITALQIGL